jgi:hypothetical protein
MLPDSDSVWERDLGMLLKQHEIGEQEKVVAKQAEMRAESEAENVRNMELEAYGGPKEQYYNALAEGKSPFTSSLTEALKPTTVSDYDWSQHDLTNKNLDISTLPMPELTYDGKPAVEGGSWKWTDDTTKIGGFHIWEDGVKIPIPGYAGMTGSFNLPFTGQKRGQWRYYNPVDESTQNKKTHISQRSDVDPLIKTGN